MAKILFISLYDQGYLGTRFLSSYLLEHGHTPHMLNLKAFAFQPKTKIRENFSGHQISKSSGYIELCDPLDNSISEKEYELLKKCIEDFNPDIIGMTTRSTNNNIVAPIISFLKKTTPHALLLAGGFGPTLEAELYLGFGIDIVVRAEGEYSLREIAALVDKSKENNSSIKEIETFAHIQNCSFLKNGKAQHNPVCPQEKDLGKFPPPLYGDVYYTHIDKDTLFNEETSCFGSYATLIGRGCIGTCSYCSGGQWFMQYKNAGHSAIKRRNRPLDNVIEELKRIDKKQYKYIHLWDEMFTAPTKDMIYFFERYKNEVNLPFFVYFSYEQFLNNPILFEKAYEAGWSYTCVGIQTGSEKFARALYNRKHKNTSYIAYAQKIFDLGITTNYHFIGGNCYETEEDFQATLDIVKALPFDYANLDIANLFYFKFNPLPKTPILEVASKLLSQPVSSHEYLYKAALVHLRRLMEDKEFEEIRNVQFYKKQPDVLLALYRFLLEKKQVLEIDRLIEKYKGKYILFYGAGIVFKNICKKFNKSNILGVLLDKKYMGESTEIEGVSVYCIEDIQNFDQHCPIIICSNKYASFLKRNLLRKYGIDKKRIHTIMITYPSYY